jgi:predicted nuclease with TOPRIM domain
MDGKIKKCTKDLESLNQTILNLKERNDKLKNNLISKRTGETDREKKAELEDKVEVKSKEMWKLKKELDNLNRDILEGRQIKKEKETQVNIIIYTNA